MRTFTPTTDKFRETILRSLRRLDHLCAPERFHRMHLPVEGNTWDFGEPLFAATLFHAGQFFAVTVADHTQIKAPKAQRVTIFLRHLSRLGEPSSNTPHLTVHSNRIEDGMVQVHPHLKRAEQAQLAPRLRRLGLIANGNAISVTRYNHPDLFPKLLAICSAIAAIKCNRHKTKQ